MEVVDSAVYACVLRDEQKRGQTAKLPLRGGDQLGQCAAFAAQLRQE